jgi:hypothetical protein
MRRGVQWLFRGVVMLVLLASCLPALAQTATGAIGGTVRDESGAVLPGVTVEATSPALIEKARVFTTDERGEYRFLRLPVGTYDIKFSLAGFGSMERAGIIINAGFTATIDARLKVGSVAETITVTGESPVVDIRGSTSSTLLTTQVIDTIPSSRNVFDMSKFVIGSSTSTPDVGGSTQAIYSAVQVHGSRGNDRGYYRDGVRTSLFYGDGDAPRVYNTVGAMQEVNYETAAIPAEIPHGGVVINMITKDGGDRWSGTGFGSGANTSMQSSNLDQKLRDRGVKAGSGTAAVYDVDGSVGLPIKKERVWFFGEVRNFYIRSLLANAFNIDGTQTWSSTNKYETFLKTTIQANRTNKLTLNFAYDGYTTPYRREEATFVSDEAAGYNTGGPLNRVIVGSWTMTKGNNWIVEAGFSYMRVGSQTTYRPEVGPNSRSRLDIITSTLSGAATRVRADKNLRQDYSVSATHVFNAGGSHELRFGSQGDWGSYPDNRFNKNDIIYRYRNGVPAEVDLVNTPVYTKTAIREYGFYIQDRWTIAKRLTINAGARYDYLHVYIPPQYAPAGTYVGERNFSKIEGVSWRDVVPRLGVSYDLLGTGRTVLKGSYSQYTGVEAAGVAQDTNPMFRSTNRCSWSDLNGDNLASADELSKCAGWAGGSTATLDPNLRRPYNREYSLGTQHQLARNLGFTLMFFRRENRDMRAYQNLAVPTSGYIPVTIANPLDNSPLVIYNQNPATAGQQKSILTNSTKLNTTYNGVEFGIQRRFSPGSYMQAGYHYGRVTGRTTSTADLNDPNLDIFAKGGIDNDEPHQLKVSGSYVLPWKIEASGFVSLASGHTKARSLSVTRTLVPTLTRSSQTVRLELNDIHRYPARKQVDIRFGRIFRVKTLRFEPFVDIYNLFNVNTVLREVTTWGSSLGTISSTYNPRLMRVGGRISF